MAIELCCQYLVEVKKRNGSIDYKNAIEEKNLQFNAFNQNKYSKSRILETYIHNTNQLHNILQRIYNDGIRCFRVSSNLFPLFDLVDQDVLHNEKVLTNLKLIGDFVIKNNMRLTTHPDQFVVISSKNTDVINKSIKILNHHSWVFDCMGLPQNTYYSINIHGGVKNEYQTLINSINSLPINTRARLTLENDERSYNVNDLLKIYEQTNVPIVFDSHHHSFNTGDLYAQDAMELAISTWQTKPITHLSNSFPEFANSTSFTDKRKHSDYVYYIPEYQLLANNKNLIDISFEFKMKNLAIFKAVKDFSINLV